MFIHALGLLAVLVTSFAAIFALTARYGILDYTLPKKAEGADLKKRRLLAIFLALLGLIAFVAVKSYTTQSLFIPVGLVSALEMINLVLMAAAGAMDVWRFKLPLPLTATGLLLSLGLRLATGGWMEALIAVSGGLILSLTWAALTRGAIGWGDYLAIIWIMLTLSTLGLIAVLVGQIALTVFHLGRHDMQVPIGGGYLLAALIFVALPFSSAVYWIPSQVQVTSATPPHVSPQSSAISKASPTVQPRKIMQDFAYHAAKIAGDTIARVALFEPEKRSAAARTAAQDLAVLHSTLLDVNAIAPSTECVELAEMLAEAEHALLSYNPTSIQAISVRREALELRLLATEPRQTQSKSDP